MRWGRGEVHFLKLAIIATRTYSTPISGLCEVFCGEIDDKLHIVLDDVVGVTLGTNRNIAHGGICAYRARPCYGEKIVFLSHDPRAMTALFEIINGNAKPASGSYKWGVTITSAYLPLDNTSFFNTDMNMLDWLSQFGEGNEVYFKAFLGRMLFPGEDGIKRVRVLSGGEKVRCLLSKMMISGANILILDEPTNHLDSAMADWLENFLKKWRGALVMITHDRYFLDSVCNRIVEVDKGAIYSYETNYSGYLERKAEREESAEASERKRQSVLRKELEWVRRGAKARTTKQKGRLQRYEELKNQKAPERDSQVEMSSVYSRMGKTTIELDHITKGYDGRTLLRDFSYIFLKGDRIGFIGANGSGKTTLMKMIAGRIKPDAGTITVGATIKIGYYTQEIETGREAGIAYMDPEEKVIDYIRNTAEYVRTTDGLVSASNMLERFLFPAAQQYSPIGKLSGGERRRLNLLRVLMEAPNVLILDEPTNDLDTQTLAILEDYLDSYEGIVIVVSHDRYFLDRVVRRIFAFEGNGEIRQYEGGYTDYVNRLAEEGRKPGGTVEVQEAAARSASAAEGAQDGGVTGTSGQDAAEQADSRNTWKREKKLKFSYKEQREYETIEDDIADLEAKVEQLDADMAENATNSVKLGELLAEKEAAEQALEEKMERWEYLEELAAKIAGQE